MSQVAFIMVPPWKTNCILLTSAFILGALMDMAESCDKDEQCKSHQVCCNDRCKSWPKCFLNGDKECYYDTHCVKGKGCVDNVCVRKKIEVGTLCENNRDCTVDVRVDDGRLTDRKFCCFGKCLPAAHCTVHLKINSSVTIKTTASSSLGNSCVETINCSTGFVCRNRICSLPENNLVSRRKKPADSSNDDSDDTSDSMSTGLLSAALFSGAVFLTFACFCFLKETKYHRRICCDQNQAQNSRTLPTCSQHSETVVTNHSTFHLNSSQHPVTRILLFPALFGEHQFQLNDRNVIDSEHNLNPPAYRTVCQSDFPPPTYDEATKEYKPT